MRRLNQTVMPVFFFLAACGSDENKNTNSDDVIFSVTYSAAEYYSFAYVCQQDLRAGWKEVSYNNKGEVLEERSCSTDETTNILKSTESSKKDEKFVETSYSETTLDSAGRLVSSSRWTNSAKSELVEEFSFTYGADGKLTSIVEKSNEGKNVATTTFDAAELPVSKTTVIESGGSKQTRVSNCFYLIEEKPCERTLDDKIEEKLTKEGDEFVRSELVNKAMVETERFVPLEGAPGRYLKRDRKSYDLFSGELNYVEKEVCTVEGEMLSCTETQTTAAGEEFFSHTSKLKNVGNISLSVGSYSATYPAYLETSGNFSVKKQKSELTGSMTSVVDTATFGLETKIILQVKTASHPALNDYFYFLPTWSETDSDMEDIFSESTLDATVSFTSVSINDSQRRELSSETKDLTGLSPEQINPLFTWKKISTYE